MCPLTLNNIEDPGAGLPWGEAGGTKGDDDTLGLRQREMARLFERLALRKVER